MTNTAVAATNRLRFELPAHLEAREPPEARGLTRDGVRMMVADRETGVLAHSSFTSLPAFLQPGDLVVINTSAVIPAAIEVHTIDGTPLTVHLSTRLDDGRWVVEPRRGVAHESQRWVGGHPPRHLLAGLPSVADGARLELIEPYLDSTRLWIAELHLPAPVLDWLESNGRPIQYGYVTDSWPITAYQNVYAAEPGSAEMPSAGRPFTAAMITRLVAKGIGVSPLVLHTGVASLEATETPYPERVKLPTVTATRVNETHTAGHRVIAVGTTVVRALETATDAAGVTSAFDGWTDLVITPERGVRAVDGLLTGWHEPEASHLLLLEAVAGQALLRSSYEASFRGGYLWHEFGDTHLILGRRQGS